MIVLFAFKSITSAPYVFLVWFYSGFVNKIFIRHLLFKEQEFLDQQLQVGVLLILFFYLLEMILRVFLLCFCIITLILFIQLYEILELFLFIILLSTYFIVFKMFIDELEK